MLKFCSIKREIIMESNCLLYTILEQTIEGKYLDDNCQWKTLTDNLYDLSKYVNYIFNPHSFEERCFNKTLINIGCKIEKNKIKFASDSFIRGLYEELCVTQVYEKKIIIKPVRFLEQSIGSVKKYDFSEVVIDSYKLSDKIINTVELIRNFVVNCDYNVFSRLMPKYYYDKNSILEKASFDAKVLYFVYPILKKDKEFMLEVVNRNGFSIKYVDESFKNDRAFVLSAVRTYHDTFAHVNISFRKDKEIILEAIKNNKKAIVYADRSLFFDKEILDEIRINNLIMFANGDIRKDHEVIFLAVKQDGLSLKYADPELQMKREIVIEAVKNRGEAIEFAENFQDDREVALEAVKTYGIALKHLSRSLRNDKEIVLTAVRQNGLSLEYASDSLLMNSQVVMEAIKQNGYVLQYVPELLKMDKEFVFKAVIANGESIGVCPYELSTDSSFLLQILMSENPKTKERYLFGDNRRKFLEETKITNAKLCSKIIEEESKIRQAQVWEMMKQGESWKKGF